MATLSLYIYRDRQIDRQMQQMVQRNSAVLYQLCHFSSKRLGEKRHHWYSTALFLYKTATPGVRHPVAASGQMDRQIEGNPLPQQRGRRHEGGALLTTRTKPPPRTGRLLQSCLRLRHCRPQSCRGKVTYCTSCATFPLRAQRKSGATGTVWHLSSTKQLPLFL